MTIAQTAGQFDGALHGQRRTLPGAVGRRVHGIADEHHAPAMPVWDRRHDVQPADGLQRVAGRFGGQPRSRQVVGVCGAQRVQPVVGGNGPSLFEAEVLRRRQIGAHPMRPSGRFQYR